MSLQKIIESINHCSDLDLDGITVTDDDLQTIKKALINYKLQDLHMIYKMKVTITDPRTEENMFSSLNFHLDCKFTYNPEQYGNGYCVTITGNNFSGQWIDLRYDKSFDPQNKAKWLEKWAKNYWSGKNGAWAIKALEISGQA